MTKARAEQLLRTFALIGPRAYNDLSDVEIFALRDVCDAHRASHGLMTYREALQIIAE